MSKLFPTRRENGEINWGLIVFILVVGGATYFVMMFVPPWYKSLQAKELVGEALTNTSFEALDEDNLRDTIVDKLKKIQVDVTPEDIEVTIDRDARSVKTIVHWRAIINYPLTKKKRAMNFYIKVGKRRGKGI